MNPAFLLVDVFTHQALAGNQLAVFPQAEGIPVELLQPIAKELNFSETTFVLPSHRNDANRRVRIFTPELELPFAGHPNLGTAFALLEAGYLDPEELGVHPANGGQPPRVTVTFDEDAGLVPIEVELEEGKVGWRPGFCRLTAPQGFERLADLEVPAVAAAVGLEERDLVTSLHPPCQVRSGVSFGVAEVATLAALARATPSPALLGAALGGPLDEPGALVPTGISLYTREVGIPADSEEGPDLRVRMFAPGAGVTEDPATGSAACVLAGLLASLEAAPDGDFEWLLHQGIEMGRPSQLWASARKQSGRVTAVGVGGRSALVAVGKLTPALAPT